MSETKNILVVDDDPEILRMVATYLTGEEYGVETASNGTRIAGASCILGWDGGRNLCAGTYFSGAELFHPWQGDGAR